MMTLDPSKIKVMNNRVLVKFIQDEPQKLGRIQIVKMMKRTKVMSRYVGLCIQVPETYVLRSSNRQNYVMIEFHDDFSGQNVVYDPLSIEVKFKWEGEEYHIVRVEDIYGVLEGFTPDGGYSTKSYDYKDTDM